MHLQDLNNLLKSHFQENLNRVYEHIQLKALEGKGYIITDSEFLSEEGLKDLKLKGYSVELQDSSNEDRKVYKVSGWKLQ